MYQASLLVDHESRANCEIQISELRRFNINIISELREILPPFEYDNHPIIILDGFVLSQNGISELLLFKELLGLNYIFVSNNEVLLQQMAEHARTYVLNTKHINYNLIMSAVNDDSEAAKPFSIATENNHVKLATMILDNAGLVDPLLKDMARYLLNVTQDNKRLYSQSQMLNDENLRLRALHYNSSSQLTHLGTVMDNMLQQSVRVNDALAQYSFICEKTVYKKVNIAEYKNRPHILYFKEYGDFLHLDTFVQTIAEVIKLQYDLPVKVLWVLDKNNPMKLKYVPAYYTLFADGVYSKPQIHVSDYMCTTGGYDTIISTICENQVSTEILIIVDSKLVDDTVVSTSDMLRFDLCRSKSKISDFGLFDSRTIVNNEEDRELSWDHFYDYSELSAEDRYLYLSNRSVVSAVVRTANKEFNIS